MSPARGAAPGTAPTADGDLTDDAAPDPAGIGCSCGVDDADELVTRHTGKSGIPLQQLEIGAADSGRQHPDHAFVAGCGRGPVGQGQDGVTIKNKRAHRARLPRRVPGRRRRDGKVGFPASLFHVQRGVGAIELHALCFR